MNEVSNSTTTDKVAAPRKVKDPLWKRLYFAFSLVVMAALVAHFAWAASGSGEWELAKDEDGIKVYTMKAPGDVMLKLRTVMEGDYTLSQLVSQHVVIGDTLPVCKQWIPGCVGFKRIMDFTPERGYDRDLWRVEVPGPFADRELLISTIFHQDKATKAVTLDVVGMPNSLPHTPGVVRLERIHNQWTYTPKPNGKVEVALIQDVGFAEVGFVPYPLLNLSLVDDSHKFFATTLRTTLLEDKYVNAKVDLVDLEDIR
ncbi:hypothetical protein [Lysobacter brunescens]|uniref:START domain-containing protein n=1 Tax=Lysobacter brunescens TaxID=262323 RepID=A0ABW2YFB9_9GAMM